MFAWLTQTMIGKMVATFFISMVPVIELRLGLPYGIALGLDYPVALALAIVGNMVPVPFIIIYLRRIFTWIRKHIKWLDGIVTKLETRAGNKGALVAKYGPIALIILVAIPLPGTGAWTGAMIAALMDIRLKHAIPAIFAGVAIAAIIMTIVTYGVGAVIS